MGEGPCPPMQPGALIFDTSQCSVWANLNTKSPFGLRVEFYAMQPCARDLPGSGVTAGGTPPPETRKMTSISHIERYTREQEL